MSALDRLFYAPVFDHEPAIWRSFRNHEHAKFVIGANASALQNAIKEDIGPQQARVKIWVAFVC
ncbi:MAG: hypothetical protein FJX45_10450 [Alphaproteobacteria bacterium]|nr:hypothetical protein [Alphaproteobacteria bacterium]MBM3654885.1 hypothetical protein [Alphaproteobacteria bacterium]